MYSYFTVTDSSLDLLKVGDRALVKFCNVQDKNIIKKLNLLGLTTGVMISVKQDFPTLIITVGTILLEIDKALARSIYVRLLEN
ncbi:MAG TPA: FeoA family protein [Leptolyngbyaceae cyanobacterium]